MHRLLSALPICLLCLPAGQPDSNAQDRLRVRVERTTYYVNNVDPKASDANDGKTPKHDAASGSGPWKTIRQAAEAMSPGDTTKILAGTYKEINLRFRNSGTSETPIRLLAEDNAGEVILDGDNTPGAVGIWLADGHRHIVIDGLTIQNMPQAGIATTEAPALPLTNLVVRNVRLRHNGDGLKFSRVDQFKLHSVLAHNNKGDGVRLRGSKNQPISHGEITACRSFDNGGNGLSVLHGQAITIDNSTFFGNENLGVQIGEEERPEHACHQVTIKSCSSHNNGGDGFSLFTASRNITLSDNKAYKNRRFGFLLFGSHKNDVRRCTAFGNTEEGFVLIGASNNTVSNNQSHHHGVNGFAVIEGSSENRLDHNESHSNGMRGFLVAGHANSNTIRENQSHHNMILGFGVYDQAKDNLFEENDIHHNIYHAFALLHNAHENRFVGNSIHHNHACGIYLEASRNNRFVKNDLHHNQLDGFAIFHQSGGNVFQNNTAHDNGAHGFLSDLSSVQVEWSKDNQAENNARGGFAKIDIDEVENLKAYTK